MRVLGIDCGSERTGYGVIDTDGRRHRLLACGVIRTAPREGFERRLLAIARRLREIIGEFAPESVAVEEVFYAQNARSALKLAHVRGVALLAAAEAGVPLGEYSALKIKQSFREPWPSQPRLSTCLALRTSRYRKSSMGHPVLCRHTQRSGLHTT